MVCVDVHDTIGTGVVVSTSAVFFHVTPRRLLDRDVVELEPLIVHRAVNIRPVVTGSRLALVHQNCMQPVPTLQKNVVDILQIPVLYAQKN